MCVCCDVAWRGVCMCVGIFVCECVYVYVCSDMCVGLAVRACGLDCMCVGVYLRQYTKHTECVHV